MKKEIIKNRRLNFINSQIKGSYIYLLSVTVFILAGSFFSFLSPKLLGIAVDSIIGDKAFDLPERIVQEINTAGGRTFFLSHIWIVVLVFFFVKLLEAGCEYMRLWNAGKLTENLGFRLRQTVFEKLQTATFMYHKGIHTGDIIQRCSTDIETVRTFVTEMTDIVRVISKIGIAYWFMSGISVPLSLISFITVPLVSGFSIFFFGRIHEKFLAADEAEGRLQRRAQENLSAPRVIRAFGKQKYERDSFGQRNKEFSDLWIQMGDMMAWFWATGDMLSVLQVVVVLCAGTLFAVKGNISSGEIIAFMVYNNMLAWPVRSLGRLVSNMSKATVSIDRIMEICNSEQETFSNGKTPDIKGDISFRNVSFSYGSQKVLDGLSFDIHSGETVAILGASGSGKSTILALLSRFIETDNGEILIDGEDIKRINLHSLRKNIGVVMQEPFLFSRSVKENIAVTDEKPDMKKVINRAKIANVHDTIEDLENGYDTLVGEKGVTLSGGQKQRIAIARTLYAGAKILCFDDSLSAVDSLTDANIRRELRRHTDGITTIIISQRVNTLMEADRIFVLDEGHIVASGTHEELLQQEGIYREIVKIQSEIIEMTKKEAMIGG